jgi:hypothetical protein
MEVLQTNDWLDCTPTTGTLEISKDESSSKCTEFSKWLEFAKAVSNHTTPKVEIHDDISFTMPQASSEKDLQKIQDLEAELSKANRTIEQLKRARAFREQTFCTSNDGPYYSWVPGPCEGEICRDFRVLTRKFTTYNKKDVEAGGLGNSAKQAMEVYWPEEDETPSGPLQSSTLTTACAEELRKLRQGKL